MEAQAVDLVMPLSGDDEHVHYSHRECEAGHAGAVSCQQRMCANCCRDRIHAWRPRLGPSAGCLTSAWQGGYSPWHKQAGRQTHTTCSAPCLSRPLLLRCTWNLATTGAPWLRAAVMGINDGLVSTASLMLGVGAGADSLRAMQVQRVHT
jgi:hypothetical protein